MTDEREFGVLEEVMAEGCQSSEPTISTHNSATIHRNDRLQSLNSP